MGIGQSRQIQLIYVPSEQATTGQWEQQPPEKSNMWAEISDGPIFRDYLTGQTQLGNTKTFKVRFRFDKYPGADWQIKYLNKVWTVISVNHVENKQFYWTMRAMSK